MLILGLSEREIVKIGDEIDLIFYRDGHKWKVMIGAPREIKITRRKVQGGSNEGKNTQQSGQTQGCYPSRKRHNKGKGKGGR